VEVEDSLLSLNAANASAAIRVAIANGCEPIAVRRVISHYRAKLPAWGPGALLRRIEVLRPDQDPAAMWPPPAKAAVQADTSAERQRVAAKALTAREEGEQRKREADAEMARLEREHGGTVNELDQDGMRLLLDEIHPKGWFATYKSIPGRGIDTEGRLRFALLTHLDATCLTPGRSESGGKERA